MFDTKAECHDCGFCTTIPAHSIDPGSKNGPLGRCPRCGAILHVERKTLLYSKLHIILMFIATLILLWMGLNKYI